MAAPGRWRRRLRLDGVATLGGVGLAGVDAGTYPDAVGASFTRTAASAGSAIDGAANCVRRHYHDFLNREPDQRGLAFWSAAIAGCGGNAQCVEGKRLNVSAAFHLSIEFQQTAYLVERVYKAAYGDAVGTSTLGGAHQLPVPVIRFDEFLLDSQFVGQNAVVNQPG